VISEGPDGERRWGVAVIAHSLCAEWATVSQAEGARIMVPFAAYLKADHRIP
jgi:hypothetical protein